MVAKWLMTTASFFRSLDLICVSRVVTVICSALHITEDAQYHIKYDGTKWMRCKHCWKYLSTLHFWTLFELPDISSLRRFSFEFETHTFYDIKIINATIHRHTRIAGTSSTPSHLDKCRHIYVFHEQHFIRIESK